MLVLKETKESIKETRESIEETSYLDGIDRAHRTCSVDGVAPSLLRAPVALSLHLQAGGLIVCQGATPLAVDPVRLAVGYALTTLGLDGHT